MPCAPPIPPSNERPGGSPKVQNACAAENFTKNAPKSTIFEIQKTLRDAQYWGE